MVLLFLEDVTFLVFAALVDGFGARFVLSLLLLWLHDDFVVVTDKVLQDATSVQAHADVLGSLVATIFKGLHFIEVGETTETVVAAVNDVVVCNFNVIVYLRFQVVEVINDAFRPFLKFILGSWWVILGWSLLL